MYWSGLEPAWGGSQPHYPRPAIGPVLQGCIAELANNLHPPAVHSSCLYPLQATIALITKHLNVFKGHFTSVQFGQNQY